MVKKKSWEEFRNTGLLLFINQLLHVFGWSIVFVIENDVVKEVYPARVKFMGFDEQSTASAYKKIRSYINENAEELNRESEDNTN